MKNNCLQLLALLTLLLLSELAFSAPAADASFAPRSIASIVQRELSTPKTYAVFVASYTARTNQAVGGVAGTAFFVSKHEALTAFHVLQAKSFEKMAGFEQRRVWLVHENEPAIEVQPEWLDSTANRDSTVIRFPHDVAVREVNLFTYAPNVQSDFVSNKVHVETDGFRGGSVGPVLAWQGEELLITSVPKLERLHAEGSLLRAVNVSVAAVDVNMKETPCYQFDYKPIVGLSGGPVLLHGRVIAMNSFADPASRASTWALQLSH